MIGRTFTNDLRRILAFLFCPLGFSVAVSFSALCCVDNFPFHDQGFIEIDRVGNITARLSSAGIKEDPNITSDSVFVLFVYNKGAILSRARALEETGQWGCPHARVEGAILVNERAGSVEKVHCMTGLGFSNDPGFFVYDFYRAYNQELCAFAHSNSDEAQAMLFGAGLKLDEAEFFHPVVRLNLDVDQWNFTVYATDSNERPSVYSLDYIPFQSLTTPRAEDESFDAYMAVYYTTPNLNTYSCDDHGNLVTARIPGSPFNRNEIEPNRISQKITIRMKFTAEGPEDLPGSLYSIPSYHTWVTSLDDLEL